MDTETLVQFRSSGFVLEGLLQRQDKDVGVVLAHPHPLYGGDMHSPVLDRVRRVYRDAGFSTLRFNFRGVGGSSGRYDDGQGEREDVLAAAAFLAEAGLSSVHLVGYSFGAWVMATLPEVPVSVQAQVYISPPVDLLNFSTVASVPRLKLVIAGSEDQFASAVALRKRIERWNPDALLKILPDTDHFFNASFVQPGDTVAQFLKDEFSG